ncbi:MAG TPA: outer membrane beta-barrel protein [Methylomusa anaerophila]|uniref:Lipid A 3-O-deacylase n=1 Tax=Methylomusa anaerophila TaxID=1930071 RepID=A0A348AG98_9FIRM|nr:outer membrane beta-barrel protein [Methylomusa anaerophila]BBB90096.1 hypothetical protein MAMMFC1_00744 [Methylomusa anaerophila]HML88179.1 outer membrane beta-barrel protein [Methylomusa anaerophila]
MHSKYSKLLASLLFCAFIMGTGPTALAGPLNHFSQGNTALDYNIKVHNEVDTKNARDTNYEWSITTALSKKFALQYRDTHYDGDVYDGRHRSNHREFNVCYELDPHYQIFVGHTWTSSKNAATGRDMPDRTAVVLGVVGIKELSKKYTLYGILATDGTHVANVEFGLAYKLAKNWELNTTYRHLTVGMGGPANPTMALRSFGIGLTDKF